MCDCGCEHHHHDEECSSSDDEMVDEKELEVNEEMNITADGGVKKKLLVKGEGCRSLQRAVKFMYIMLVLFLMVPSLIQVVIVENLLYSSLV